MKKHPYISLFVYFVIYLIMFTSCFKSFETPENGGTDPILPEDTYLTSSKITVTFASVPDNINITISSLKYNKDFCLGMHLDDGQEDIYTHAYQLLNGGEVEGVSYQGLKYTDGCGNDIKFKMSTAIYCFDNYEETDLLDPQIPSPFVKWPMIDEMYKNGWGVYNHGHTGELCNDPLFSIVTNHNYVKSKTTDEVEGGINMRIFANPNGDLSYTNYAFQQNYLVAFVESYSFGVPYFDVTANWSKSNICMGRTNLLPHNLNLLQLVDEMAALSINGAHYWGSTFTHSVTDQDFGYNFETFKSYMTYIANNYGKEGLDNIWMTTEEETLDYSTLKDLLVINQSFNGNILEITFSGNIPGNMRFYNTSLILTSNTNITSIEIEGAIQSSSYNGLNTNTSLLNIDCSKQ